MNKIWKIWNNSKVCACGGRGRASQDLKSKNNKISDVNRTYKQKKLNLFFKKYYLIFFSSPETQGHFPNFEKICMCVGGRVSLTNKQTNERKNERTNKWTNKKKEKQTNKHMNKVEAIAALWRKKNQKKSYVLVRTGALGDARKLIST